jgi:hypothetical protein
MVDVEGLRQILESAALKCRHGAVEIRVRGHDDHGQSRETLLHLVEQLKARIARHPDVRHEHAWIVGAQRLEHFVDRNERLVRNAFPLERLLEHPANGAIVIDDPDRFHRDLPHGLTPTEATVFLIIAAVPACAARAAAES